MAGSSRRMAGTPTYALFLPRCDVVMTDPLTHFRSRLAVETDCSDVHAAMAEGPAAFVLVDARSAEAYASGHVAGAVNLPHASIDEQALARWTADTEFVTYCWGPHCNAATKAAAAIASLGRPVKEMIGGVWGWAQEGHDLVTADHAAETTRTGAGHLVG